jgi:hypothetical protein
MDNAAHGEAGDPPAQGFVAFLKAALLPVFRRELLVPAAILLILLTFSNVLILSNMPSRGSSPPLAFMIAAFVRVAGLLVLAVGILRILTGSSRPRWLPDGGFWLYVLTFLASAAASGVVARLLGRADAVSLLLNNVLVTLLLAPLVVWFVAIAVAKPLAWTPGPWLRDLRAWLPQLLVWTLLLVTPMAVLHASIDLRLIAGAGQAFWPLALFDGALSTLMALVGLGLNAAAYRRVARS